MKETSENTEDGVRSSHIYLIRVPRGDSKENGGKAVFKEIMTENFSE